MEPFCAFGVAPSFLPAVKRNTKKQAWNWRLCKNKKILPVFWMPPRKTGALNTLIWCCREGRGEFGWSHYPYKPIQFASFDCIVTENYSHAWNSLPSWFAACFINASTRFSDGNEFDWGWNGNQQSKLHVRALWVWKTLRLQSIYFRQRTGKNMINGTRFTLKKSHMNDILLKLEELTIMHRRLTKTFLKSIMSNVDSQSGWTGVLVAWQHRDVVGYEKREDKIIPCDGRLYYRGSK